MKINLSNGKTFELMKNEWRIISNFGGYEVSNHGDVRKFGSKNNLKGVETKRGRIQVTLYSNGKPKTKEVHRLVAETFISGKDSEVNHKDGNPKNNCVYNLEWCTRRENMDHAVENGLRAKGEKNGSSKLTEKQVREILRDYRYRDNGVKLADKYGVTPRIIYEIVKGRLWK